MATDHPSATDRAVEQLLVKPREAWRMLGCGNSHGYELLNAGELESFRDGSTRKITVSSIRSYIARKLAAAGKTSVASQTRRRGLPRKLPQEAAR